MLYEMGLMLCTYCIGLGGRGEGMDTMLGIRDLALWVVFFLPNCDPTGLLRS